jgi:hypothetical protein
VSGANTATWPIAFLIIGALALIAVVIVVVIQQGAITWRARVSAARDNEYRELAARATAVQENLATELSQLRIRVESIEALLRTVD